MKRRELMTAGAALLAVPTLAFAKPQAFSLRRPARTILVEGGDYYRYQTIFQATVHGLMRQGVIEDGNVPIPEGTQSIQPMWKWLVREGRGRLLFLPDGWYSYEWNPMQRESVRSEILRRLSGKKDVDLILTIGTDASFDMARSVSDIPVISLNSADPVAMGVVKSAEDSGKDNVHAMVTGDFWRWQMLRFHSIFHFKRLAIVAAKKNLGRSGIQVAQELAKTQGFELFVRTYLYEDNRTDLGYPRFRKAVEEALDIDKADAFYLPWFPANADDMPDLVKLFTDRGVPVFTQTGIEEVKRGILLGAGSENMEGIGLFEARVIEKVLSGVKPRDINQIYSQNQGLAINLKTAMQMGWQPPLGLLTLAEKTFTTQSAVLR